LRLTPEEADHERARALPPIAGFADPPLRQAGPPSPSNPGELWTVMLEDVDVGVRELWIHHYRYVGEARTQGGFFMKPGVAFMVLPSVLDVRSGAVTVAGHTLAQGVEGRLTCALLPLDPATLEGPDVFDAVIGTVALDAQVPGLDFLTFYAPP